MKAYCCIWCTAEKPATEFNVEHVMPRSFGTFEANLVYKNKKMRNHLASCVRHNDYLYGFDDSTLACMNS